MHTFTTTTPPLLSIEFRAGDIIIDARDVTETTVELTGADDRETQTLIAETVVEQRDDVVVVRVPKRSPGLFGRSHELRLAITTPTGSRLSVQTGSADLTARGTFAESRVTTGSGDVTVERLAGAAQVRSGSGDIRVDSLQADLTVGAGSGDVVLGDSTADVTLQSGSGDVQIASVSGVLRAKTGSGDIAVGRADADVSTQTGSGDVSLRRVRVGRVKAKAASGDLYVGVAAGTAAWLDVRSISGSVRSDLDSADGPAADEQQVRLELSTASGDIAIAHG